MAAPTPTGKQNLVNPPPVPEVPTVTSTFGCSLRNSSVMASEIGATVEDPSTTILPEAGPPLELPPASSAPPHAAATRASTSVGRAASRGAASVPSYVYSS